jgi:phosphatidate cytidylyltransferase
MFILFVIEICHGVDTLSVVRILLSFFGIFFIPMTLMHIILIRNLYYGRSITLFTFIITWTVDSMAYIIGSLYGKHKLVKNISPKKTIEGAISGTICGVLVAILLQYTYSFNNILSLPMTITLGCIISIIGQFSDIAESIIKRDNQIKNSSCLIPGHGGILDRFDSYIFVAPSVYYLLTICYKF